MKTTTKTIALVLAVFLVAALFIGGASAARDVTDKDRAFVYENITIDSGITVPLIHYSGDASPVVLNTIDYDTTAGHYSLLESSVNGMTGAYYYSGDPKNGGQYILIEYPSMTLGGYIDTSSDTINGKTVTEKSLVRFEIESRVGSTNDAMVDIWFTRGSGKSTEFGGESFANKPLTSDRTRFDLVSAVTGSNGSNVAGVYAVQAEFKKAGSNNLDFDFIGSQADKYKKSNVITFTVQSSTLTLTADKDSVIRSNPFSVVIQGESLTVYYVYLDGASGSKDVPQLRPEQSGMQGPAVTNQTDIPMKGTGYVTTLINGTSGYFKTDAAGKRTVEYNTYPETDDKTYTIKVVGLTNYGGVKPIMAGDDNDQVKIKVEKGAVTVTASGDRSYYIGEEIKFTGTNTDSTAVYLFITGPNLITDGVDLRSLAGTPPIRQEARNSSSIAVKTDNTWEYKWDTANSGLDTGAYTIYATTKLTNGKSSSPSISNKGDVAVKLSDSEYATVSINLKQPFLSATPSGTYVAKGDKVYIRGTAEGDPAQLKIYIFGPNKFVTDTISVEDDGTYEYKLEVDSAWASNQYYIVIEHPMYNNVIDVYTTAIVGNGNTAFTDKDATGVSDQLFLWIPADTQDLSKGYQASFIVWGNGKLQGSNAADALTKMIDDANIDDLYTKLTITVQEPWIRINNPGDQAVSTTFAVSGTTNLAVDDQILVEIVSSSFTAIDKTSTSTTSGYSQSTKVVAGDGTDNAWSVDVDSTNFKLDEYTIKASGIEADVTTTTNFNIVEQVVVTPTTVAPTGAPTSAPTTAAPTTAPSTPGFGAFIALAGLGAVALLVLRRN